MESSSVFYASIGLAYQVENVVCVSTPERKQEIQEFLEERSHSFQMGIVIHP